RFPGGDRTGAHRRRGEIPRHVQRFRRNGAMTPRRALLTAGLTVVAAALGWLLFVGLPRWYGPRTESAAAKPPAAPQEIPGRKIKARLFSVTEEGTRLTPVEQDVPFAEQTVEQARQIVIAQIAPPAEPLVSPVPAATKLRALFITDRGDAFVDLSSDVVTAHP